MERYIVTLRIGDKPESAFDFPLWGWPVIEVEVEAYSQADAIASAKNKHGFRGKLTVESCVGMGAVSR